MEMRHPFIASTLVTLALCGCGGGGDSSTGPGEPALSAVAHPGETGASIAATDGISAEKSFSKRAITNGSFETGNTTGWQVHIDLGFSSLLTPHVRPAGTVTVVDSWTFGTTTRLPYDGQHFLSVGTGHEWFDGRGTYDITASQTVLLHKGDTITGASFYFNGDFAAQDTVWVKVFDKFGNLLATPWIEFSGNGNPGDHNAVPYTQSTDWTPWQWKAPKTGLYTLKLGATTFGDNLFATYGFHDAISVVLAGKKKPLATTTRWPHGIPSQAPFFQH
jgi:hypothetical protein